MKKAIAAIALFCYLAVSCGVVINFHYCMHRLASTRLFGSTKNVCGKCGVDSKKSNGCCHDEVKVVKLQQDQQSVQTGISIKSPGPTASLTSLFLILPFQNIDGIRHNSDHSPPLLPTQDIYLQNGVFRI